jgi:hypothetical protein
MAKQQPNSQLHRPNAPEPLKKEQDAKTEPPNRMEDVICINKLILNQKK